MPFDGDPANYVAVVPAESAADLLVRASHYLNLGWCQGTIGRGTGEVCAIGALLAVTGGTEIHNYSSLVAIDQIGRHAHGVRAFGALKRAAIAHGFSSVAGMNDHRRTTKKHMVALFMEAAARVSEDVP